MKLGLKPMTQVSLSGFCKVMLILMRIAHKQQDTIEKISGVKNILKINKKKFD